MQLQIQQISDKGNWYKYTCGFDIYLCMYIQLIGLAFVTGY